MDYDSTVYGVLKKNRAWAMRDYERSDPRLPPMIRTFFRALPAAGGILEIPIHD